MVQMKVIHSNHPFLTTFLLYIPHGSDESSGGSFFVYLKFSLYIPHGSDES